MLLLTILTCSYENNNIGGLKMWVLLIIVFSQPYHVATVNILGTYIEKAVCVSEQKRAMTIGTITRTSFGCVKIEGEALKCCHTMS